jgi:hypothetical protein
MLCTGIKLSSALSLAEHIKLLSNCGLAATKPGICQVDLRARTATEKKKSKVWNLQNQPGTGSKSIISESA